MKIHVDIHYHAHPTSEHEETIALLRTIIAQGEKIMAALQDALDKITDIEAKTDTQGLALQQIATNLQSINNDIDDLIAQHGNNVPQVVLDRLNALATKTQTNKDAVDAQATFSESVGNKWPLPPPPPPPPPVP